MNEKQVNGGPAVSNTWIVTVRAMFTSFENILSQDFERNNVLTRILMVAAYFISYFNDNVIK